MHVRVQSRADHVRATTRSHPSRACAPSVPPVPAAHVRAAHVRVARVLRQVQVDHVPQVRVQVDRVRPVQAEAVRQVQVDHVQPAPRVQARVPREAHALLPA
ncbi:hypothetical protein GCM10009628_36540 [Paeniglutamicibacter kerguelensis]